MRTEDLKAVFPMALTHRVLLNFKAQSEGITVDQILEHALKQVKEI